MANICNKCGTPLNGGNFCTECGAPISTIKKKAQFCLKVFLITAAIFIIDIMAILTIALIIDAETRTLGIVFFILLVVIVFSFIKAYISWKKKHKKTAANKSDTKSLIESSAEKDIEFEDLFKASERLYKASETLYEKPNALDNSNSERSYKSYEELKAAEALPTSNVSMIRVDIMDGVDFENKASETLYEKPNTLDNSNSERSYKSYEELKAAETLPTSNVSMIRVDIMDGVDFENFVAKLLSKLDYYNIETMPASNDYGIDIIAHKYGSSYAIQCKRYAEKVSNSAVQEAATGKTYYNCDYAVVITNNYFTANAIQLAEKADVILWDRDYLQKMMSEAYPVKQDLSFYFDNKSTNISLTNTHLINNIASIINDNIAFGAVLGTTNENVLKVFREFKLIKPYKEHQYPEFLFDEKEWDECERDVIKLVKYLKNKNLWYNKNLADIDRFTESDFSLYICNLLEGIGFEKVIATDNDNDVDITCEKEHIKYAVKCKHSFSKEIDIKPIRNIIVGKNQHKCHIAIVITNNYFSKSAEDIAENNSIVLINRDKLQSILNGNYDLI